MAKIDHTNWSTTLKKSTQPRSGTPDGNVYFNQTTGELELITQEQLATVDLGAGAVANPLLRFDGITARALYLFENDCRTTDETLRKYPRYVDGDYRFVGAYSLINGRKIAAADVSMIRDSGLNWYADKDQTQLSRTYHGVRTLVGVEATTTPRYCLVTATDESSLQSATWSAFGRAGPVNELVQVFGTTTYGDSSAGSFDYRTRILLVSPRSWQFTPIESTSLDAGIAEFAGFSGGYGAGETANPQNTYAIADVYGGAAVSPFTGLSLERPASPQVESGFNEVNGTFTWVLRNTLGATVAQCAAYLDAVALQDADVDAAAGTSYNGRKGRIWYTRDAQGRVVTRSVGGDGLLIEGLGAAEKQKVVMTDDAGATKTYPFAVSVELTVGSGAVGDTDAWFHLFYLDGAGAADWGAAGAVTVNDADGDPVKGNVAASPLLSGTKLIFSYDYDGNTQAGLAAGADKTVVALLEGNGGVAQKQLTFTITRTPTIAVDLTPPAENNA
jgi:hypothetical protein